MSDPEQPDWFNKIESLAKEIEQHCPCGARPESSPLAPHQSQHMNNSLELDALISKLEKRIARYRYKRSNASGTDRVSLGGKIRATTECLGDILVYKSNISHE